MIVDDHHRDILRVCYQAEDAFSITYYRVKVIFMIHRFKELLIRTAVRTRFQLTSRDQASDQIRRSLTQYL